MKKTGRIAYCDNAELVILRIAFLLSAVDGHIDEKEYDFLGQLLYSSHVAPEMDLQRLIEETRLYSENLAEKVRSDQKLDVAAEFMKIADSFCCWETMVDSPVMLRKAFSIWVAMVMADDCFCDVERSVIKALQEKVNSIPRISDGVLGEMEDGVGKLKLIKKKIARSKNQATKIKLRAESQKILAQMDIF